MSQRESNLIYLWTVTPSCVEVFKVKAVCANRMKQAESCWAFFSGFPPSLILCSSPSGLGAGSCTRPGCWWRVGTCLDLLFLLSEAEGEREAEREREGRRGERLVVNSLPVWSDPYDGRALQHPWTHSCWCQRLGALAGDGSGWRSCSAAWLLGEWHNSVWIKLLTYNITAEHFCEHLG